MIETRESRAEFQKRREKAIAAFKHAVRGELPLEEGVAGNKDELAKFNAVVQPNVAQLTEAIKGKAEAEQKVAQHESKRKHRKRDKYWWRQYRKRPKKCPHCGRDL